jgi:hypothetical protein
MGGSDSRGDVRFRIDRGRAGSGVKRTFFARFGHGGICSDDLGVQGRRQLFQQALRPRRVGRKKPLSGSYGGCNDPMAGRKTRRQSAGNPKTDDARDAAGDRCLERSRKLRPRSADHGHPRPERYASL